jgi:hypothetical protein
VKVLHHRDRVARTGATAVFVVHDTPEQVRAGLLLDLDLPWPVLVDPDRVAYRAWGLRRAAFRTVWLDPRVWARYGCLLLGGERLQRLGRDTLQLGGDFVVDPDGVITWARPQRADDRPPVGVLLTELERAARGRPLTKSSRDTPSSQARKAPAKRGDLPQPPSSSAPPPNVNDDSPLTTEGA